MERPYSLTGAQEGAFPVIWRNPGLWILSLCSSHRATSSTRVSPVELLSVSQGLVHGEWGRATLLADFHQSQTSMSGWPSNLPSRASLGRYSPQPFYSPQRRTMLNISGTIFLMNPQIPPPALQGGQARWWWSHNLLLSINAAHTLRSDGLSLAHVCVRIRKVMSFHPQRVTVTAGDFKK